MRKKSPFIKLCLLCGKPLGKGENKYCCLDHQNIYLRNQYIEKWKNGEEDGIRGKYLISHRIRHFLFEKYNNKCSRCGWGEINPYTGRIPLEVHHEDGNYLNNSEDNLELLCPNCHALTETYKNANKGKGRSERMKYYNN